MSYIIQFFFFLSDVLTVLRSVLFAVLRSRFGGLGSAPTPQHAIPFLWGHETCSWNITFTSPFKRYSLYVIAFWMAEFERRNWTSRWFSWQELVRRTAGQTRRTSSFRKFRKERICQLWRRETVGFYEPRRAFYPKRYAWWHIFRI